MRGPYRHDDQRLSPDHVDGDQIAHESAISELERFVIQQNIEHFSKMALEASDPAARSIVLQLLGEEQSKLLKFQTADSD